MEYHNEKLLLLWIILPIFTGGVVYSKITNTSVAREGKYEDAAFASGAVDLSLPVTEENVTTSSSYTLETTKNYHTEADVTSQAVDATSMVKADKSTQVEQTTQNNYAEVITPSYTELQPFPKRKLSDEEFLMQYLLEGYNPTGRPVLNGKHTVNVDIMFSLLHIKEVDMKSQTLTTAGLLILEWLDERLTWIPAEHNGLTELFIEIAHLWQPEFALINGAEDIYEEYSQFRAVVSYTGLVHWEPGGVFKSMCPIDVTYYPFDHQMCSLKIGAWTYHTAKMNISSSSDIINQDAFRKNGEWNILHTRAYRNQFSFKQTPNESYSFVNFEIYLRRRHKYYILNVILPSLMTSVLLLSVFFSPPAQKVKIGVVVLLSYMIFLVNVSKSIPKTSDNIPMLAVYLTCILAMTTLSMVLTVFILNLYNISDRPVPAWTKGRIFTGLARMIGMCHSADILSQEEEYIIDTDMIHMTEKVTPVRKKLYSQSSTIEEIKSEEPKEDYSREWKQFAEILDRMFFWIFSLGLILSTSIIFHPLMKEN